MSTSKKRLSAGLLAAQAAPKLRRTAEPRGLEPPDFHLPAFASPQDLLQAAQARLLQLATISGVDGASVLKGKLDDDAARAWERNHRLGREGTVDCGQIRRAQADPRCAGAVGVGVSKQRGKIGQALSPFFLPVPKGMQSFATDNGQPDGRPLPEQPLELVWQAAKVRMCEIGEDGLTKDSYFKRRAEIYKKGDVRRRYIRPEEIGGSLLSWRDIAPVQWVPSRKFYCSAYSRAVADVPAFKFLELLKMDGFNLLLLGPDGHACFEKASTTEVAKKLADAYIDTGKQFGHERVLVAMLLRAEPWKEMPDPTGDLRLCS